VRGRYHPRRSGGLASLLVQLKNALTIGLMTGRVVTFYDAQRWPLVAPRDCGTKTFDCLLHPLSQCKLTTAEQREGAQHVDGGPAYLNPLTVGQPETQARRVVHGNTGLNAFSKLVPRAFADKDQFWWFAQAMAYLFRPKIPVIIKQSKAGARSLARSSWSWSWSSLLLPRAWLGEGGRGDPLHARTKSRHFAAARPPARPHYSAAAKLMVSPPPPLVGWLRVCFQFHRCCDSGGARLLGNKLAPTRAQPVLRTCLRGVCVVRACGRREHMRGVSARVAALAVVATAAATAW
jgi:hypothetical protein